MMPSILWSSARAHNGHDQFELRTVVAKILESILRILCVKDWTTSCGPAKKISPNIKKKNHCMELSGVTWTFLELSPVSWGYI
jgi:hypothetical protein